MKLRARGECVISAKRNQAGCGRGFSLLSGAISKQTGQLVPDSGNQEQIFQRAFALLRNAIAMQVFPGAALAVTAGDRLVAWQGFGRFTYEPDAPVVSAETVFDLASVSKVAGTTAMAMVLFERGVLDLDMPVASVLPRFAAEDARRDQVTLRMLLAHSSGLPAYVRFFQQTKTRDEVLAALYAVPLEAEPGTRTAYSDPGFMLLGLALERLADEQLDSFCRREIFGPLGMAHTTFNPPPEWRPRIPPTADDREFRRRVVQGEVQDENAWVLGGVAGHAGVFAEARDVARFAHAMLRGGQPILRPATVKLFTRRQEVPTGTTRALGWDTPSQPSQSGSRFSSHTFGHLGYTGTSLWIDPEREISVTLLSNRTWPDCQAQKIKEVRPRVHDAILEALA